MKSISVRNENEVFGIIYKAGVKVYDRNTKKMYVLLALVEAIDSLASFDDKKELGGTLPILTMTVGQSGDTVFTGYRTIQDTYGEMNPNTLEGRTVEHFYSELSVISNQVRFAFVIRTQINGLFNLPVNVDGYGDVTLIWGLGGAAGQYSIVSEALNLYIRSQIGNDIILTFTL